MAAIVITIFYELVLREMGGLHIHLMSMYNYRPNLLLLSTMTTSRFTQFYGMWIFLLFATSVTIPHGLAYSALILFILGIFIIIKEGGAPPLTRPEKWLVASMIGYPSMVAVNMFYHGNWIWAEFDYPSRYLFAVIIFLAVRRTNPSPNFLFYGAILGALGAGIGALYQTEILNIVRAYGLAEAQRISFSLIALLSAMLAICGYKPLIKIKHWNILLIGLAVISGTYASAMSGSRGGWVALPMYMWLLIYLTDNPSIKKQILLLTSMLVAATGIYLSSEFIQTRIDQVIPTIYNYFINDKITGSVSQRFELWYSAILMFNEAPLFGQGMETFLNLNQQLIAEGRIDSIIVNVRNPHNELFNALSETGIIGLTFTFLPYIVFSYICKQHLKSNPPLAVAGLIFAVAHIDVGLSFSIITLSMTTTMWVVGIAIIAGMLSAHNSEINTNRNN